MPSLSPEKIQEYQTTFHELSNSAKYKQAHTLAKRLMKKHPDVFLFAYMEAVMSAEEFVGFTQKEIDIRYKNAAAKLKKLLSRIRWVPEDMRRSLRNEYYWFSKQPRKQYLLGVEEVKKGNKKAYYPQGVGAVMLAKKYAEAGKKALFLRWSKRSQKAWENYFKITPNWYNAYLFYATALGHQGKNDEMEKALKKASDISRKPIYWKGFKEIRKEVDETLKLI